MGHEELCEIHKIPREPKKDVTGCGRNNTRLSSTHAWRQAGRHVKWIRFGGLTIT